MSRFVLLHVLARYINLVIEFVPLYVYINLVMILNLIPGYDKSTKVLASRNLDLDLIK